jgi:hypothetical protein
MAPKERPFTRSWKKVSRSGCLSLEIGDGG